MKASHKEYTQVVGYQQVAIVPGQFVFGRKAASEELEMSERKIRTCLNNLSKMGNVTIKTTNKYSVITIVNWHIYQGEETLNDQHNDQQATSKRPASDHKQEHKNVRTRINTLESNNTFVLPDWIPVETWQAYIEVREKKRAVKTPYAYRLIIKELEKIKAMHGHDPVEVLNKSIKNGWTDVYPLKEQQSYPSNHTIKGDLSHWDKCV